MRSYNAGDRGDNAGIRIISITRSYRRERDYNAGTRL